LVLSLKRESTGTDTWSAWPAGNNCRAGWDYIKTDIGKKLKKMRMELKKFNCLMQEGQVVRPLCVSQSGEGQVLRPFHVSQAPWNDDVGSSSS
jgi:hypothetical protein